MGGWMDEWMGFKPGLRDCLAQSNNTKYNNIAFSAVFK
jgi:hypothetical protein